MGAIEKPVAFRYMSALELAMFFIQVIFALESFECITVFVAD